MRYLLFAGVTRGAQRCFKFSTDEMVNRKVLWGCHHHPNTSSFSHRCGMANMETTILPALPPSLLQSGWKENPAAVAWMRVFHSCLSVKDNPACNDSRPTGAFPTPTRGAGTAIPAQLTASSKHPVESAQLVPRRIGRSSSNGLGRSQGSNQRSNCSSYCSSQ